MRVVADSHFVNYDHPEELIPDDADIVVTHEPPIMVLNKSHGTHWGNLPLRNLFSLEAGG